MANANFIVQNGISLGGAGGATITADPTTGAVAIAPAATVSNPNPTATVFTTSGTVTTVATTGGVANVANIATASNTATVGTGINSFGNITIANIFVNGTTGSSGQFLSSNGAGLTWQTLSASSISNGTSNVTVNSGSLAFGVSGANVAMFTPSTLSATYGGNLVMNGSIIPSANVTYALGSITRQWKDIYVGPGSLYVNGKQVISDTSGTITFSTDSNQNLSIQTAGTGDIQINPTGTGAIAMQGPIKVTAGKYFISSDGNAIGFSNQIAVDSITSKSSNTNLVLSAAGSGIIQVNDSITGGGTVTFSDSTATTAYNNGALVVTGGVGVGGDVRVNGNVYAYGMLAVQTNQIAVTAPLLYLAEDTPYPYSFDIGMYSHFIGGSANSYQHTGFVRSQANGYWGLFSNVQSEPTSTVNWSDTQLMWDKIKTGDHIIANTTSATSTTTGALQVAGGAGIAGQLYVGANVTVTGNVLPSANVTYNLGSPTARWKDLYLSGSTIDLGGTTISAPAGGAFAVTTGNIVAGATTVSTSTTTGSFIAAGGVGIAGALYNGGVHISSGNVVAASGTASTSTTTGALVVAGGAGISGNVFTGGWVVPTANVTQNLGTTTNYWNNIYGITFVGTSTTAKYADLAENYQADKPYMPGTVLQFGGSHEVTVAETDTTRVAGVVSTNPAHLMNGALSGANVVPLALTGRVPCMIIGPVAKGDIMVSAGHGYARANNNPAPGQAIGKAVEAFASSAKGVIEVVVGRV